MNNISIVGRVTKDIEVTTTSNGVQLARFNVAVASEFKDETGEKRTDFFMCVAWRDMAVNIAKYFQKGSPIGLVGSMNSRRYGETGDEKTIWELNVRTFSFVGGTTDEDFKRATEAKKGKGGKQISIIPVEDEDNLPF